MRYGAHSGEGECGRSSTMAWAPRRTVCSHTSPLSSQSTAQPEAIPMKPIRSTSRHLRGLSRRDFLWIGSASFATGLLSPVLVGLAIKQSRGAGESGMDVQGHAGARSVPRAPYQKGTPLIEPEVRRSVNGELRTTLHVRYTYKDIGGYRLYLRSYEG